MKRTVKFNMDDISNTQIGISGFVFTIMSIGWLRNRAFKRGFKLGLREGITIGKDVSKL